jgi:hypothetical protein
MNVLLITVLLYLSVNFILPLIYQENLNEYNLNNFNNLLYFSLFILINLIIFNIIFNIFKKSKDSLFLIITKNFKNTFLILTFLLIFYDLQNIFIFNNNQHLQSIFIVSPLILKSFILSLFQEY